MAFVPFKEFGIMRNLRTVGIAKTQGKILNIPGKHLKKFPSPFTQVIQYNKL